MKLAKKMLACVIALALVGCFALTAFAATPEISFVVGEVEDDVLPITVFLKNAVGFKSGDFVIKYNKAVLAYSYDEKSADAKSLDNTKSNGFTVANNGETAGIINSGFYFTETLTTKADAVAQAKNKKVAADIVYDENNFEIFTLYFDVTGDLTKADMSFSGSYNIGDAKTEVKDTAVVVKAPEKETEKATDKVTEKPTEKVTDKIPDTGNDPNTGDNMALAAAAGVVLLAGAAFVITKKRK